MRDLIEKSSRERSLLLDNRELLIHQPPYFLQTTVDDVVEDELFIEIDTSGIRPIIDWGDGTQDQPPADITKQYGGVGVYEVNILSPMDEILTIDIDSRAEVVFRFHPELVNMTRLDIQAFNQGEVFTYPTWTSLKILAVSATDVSLLQTHPEWASLEQFAIVDCSLASIDTHKEWTNLEIILLHLNGLETVDTFAEWTLLGTLGLRANFLQDVQTHPEWVNITHIDVAVNLISELVTHPEWTLLEQIRAEDNVNLNSIKIHPAWNSLVTLRLNGCDLSATAIDDALIQLDAASGIKPIAHFQYENNPGSADVDRSPAAAAAKISLSSKGWIITN